MAKGQIVESILSGLVDISGNPLASGKVYAYEVGTSTPKSLYTDKDATSAADNPLTLDANGTSRVYAYGSYKFVIKTAADATVVTADNLIFTPEVTSFVPTFTCSGSMTVTSTTIYQAIYWRTGSRVDFVITAQLTLGGTASTAVYFTLPVTMINTPIGFWSGNADINSAGRAGWNSTTQGILEIHGGSNWNLGASRNVNVGGSYIAA